MPKGELVPTSLSYPDEEIQSLAAALEPLVKHPGWLTFTRVLRDAVIVAHEQGFSDLAEVVRWAGRADGLKQAWELPELIVAEAKRMIRDEDLRTKKPGPMQAPRRKHADDQLTS